jgi:hypothetical protein
MRLADLRLPSVSEKNTLRFLGIPETGGIPLKKLADPLQRVFHLKVEYAHLTVEQLSQAVAVDPAIVSLKLGPRAAHAVVVDSIRNPWPKDKGATYRISVEDFRRFFEQEGDLGKALIFRQQRAR